MQGLLKTAALATLVLPLLVLAVPVLDTSFVVAKRLKNRQPIYVADARHLHHRFMRIGFSQRRAVVYLYAWCVTLALAALATRFAPPHHHGRWSTTNLVIDALAGLVAIAFSLYVVYLLEIVKLTSPRARRRDKLPAPPERRHGGIPAGGAVHAAAGVRRERREIETRDVGARPAPARASEDELVVQLRGPAVHPPRRQERDVPLADESLESAARRSTSSSRRFAVRSASASGGTCVYAQAVSLPSGARVASPAAYWPKSTNGRCGSRPCASSAEYSVSASSDSARWTTGARRAASAVHGTTASSVQSTLTTAGSGSTEAGSDGRAAG